MISEKQDKHPRLYLDAHRCSCDRSHALRMKKIRQSPEPPADDHDVI